MIYHKVAPRSVEWFNLRAGIPTSSEFHKIVTPGGKPVKKDARERYMYGLLAEWMLGHPITGPETDWMQRGTELEDEAVEAYEFQTDAETQPGGFITLDNGMVGCSPDRLIRDVGDLEIKCAAPNTHIKYMLGGDLEQDYYPQLQGRLWIHCREWVDICAYCPCLPHVIIRITRDEDYITLLSAEVNKFVADMLAARELLESKYGPPRKPEEQAGPDLSKYELKEDDAEAIIRHHFPQ